VRAVDPDERDQKIMEVVIDYYKTLEKIYVIHVKRVEIENSHKDIRPEYLSKFYMNIEKQLNELLYENSELVPNQIPAFKMHVRKFFQREFFHNSHFFLALLYKE